MNESSLYFTLCRVRRRITRLPDIFIRPVTSEYRQRYFIEIPAAGTFRYFIVMEMDVRSGDVASCRKEGHDSSNANSPSACFLWRGFKEATVYFSLSLSFSLFGKSIGAFEGCSSWQLSGFDGKRRSDK